MKHLIQLDGGKEVRATRPELQGGADLPIRDDGTEAKVNRSLVPAFLQVGPHQDCEGKR